MAGILYVRDEYNERWLPCVSGVGALPDVDILSGVQNGHALLYDENSGSPRWTSGSVGTGGGTSDVQYLNDLLDVTAGSPAQGYTLVYNESSGKWEATAQSGSAGDMYKSTYDPNDDGVVTDSDKLGGELPSYYAVADHSHNNFYYTKPDLLDSSGSAQVHWNKLTNKPQHYPPGFHGTAHESSGSDAINVQGLSGVLADRQDANKIYGRDIETGAPANGQVMVWRSATSKWTYEQQTGGSGGGGGTSGSGMTPVWEDVTSQIPDPSNNFDLAHVFVANTLLVFYNGTLQQPSKFSEDGDFAGFTTSFSPVAGDTLVAFYFRQMSTTEGADTISIQEQDGTPSLDLIHTIIVGNDDLVDEGGGVARIKTASDAIVAVSDQDVLMMQIFC